MWQLSPRGWGSVRPLWRATKKELFFAASLCLEVIDVVVPVESVVQALQLRY